MYIDHILTYKSNHINSISSQHTTGFSYIRKSILDGLDQPSSICPRLCNVRMAHRLASSHLVSYPVSSRLIHALSLAAPATLLKPFPSTSHNLPNLTSLKSPTSFRTHNKSVHPITRSSKTSSHPVFDIFPSLSSALDRWTSRTSCVSCEALAVMGVMIVLCCIVLSAVM